MAEKICYELNYHIFIIFCSNVNMHRMMSHIQCGKNMRIFIHKCTRYARFYENQNMIDYWAKANTSTFTFIIYFFSKCLLQF